jgi:DNA-binding protein HU-beta
MATKANLVERVAAEFSLSKRKTARVLEFISALVHENLVTDGEAVLPGLGKLKIRHHRERQGRNPRTGEALTIGARNVVKFSATRSLKDFAVGTGEPA